METFSFDFSERMKLEGIQLHSFSLMLGSLVKSSFYYAPVDENSLQRVFSICKVFTALGVGLLADEEKIALEAPICSYFPEYTPKEASPWLLQMTIEDMLMMRSCHANSTYNKFDLNSNWCESFFTTKPTKEPGTAFSYDTSAAHVLAVLVEKKTNMRLLDYIRYRLPQLNLSDEAYTLLDPQGYTMGGTGLMCTLDDMLSLGKLLLFTNIEGKEPDYLSPFMISFIKKACSNLTSTEKYGKNEFEKQGYGYQIWQAKHEGFVCYGLGGQFIMVHPKKELIFVITADTQGHSSQNQRIFDIFYETIYDKITDAVYKKPILNTVYSELLGPEGSSARARIDNYYEKEYVFDNNVSSFTSFSLKRNISNESELILSSNVTTYSLSFGMGKNIQGLFPGYNMKYVGNGAFIDEHTLKLRFSLLDTSVGSIEMIFTFMEEKIKVSSCKHEETLFNEFNFESMATLAK